MNEKKNIFIGSIIAYVTIFVEVVLSIVFTPFLLKQLGDVNYGIRSFCTSLVSYLNLLTLGLGGAYFRFRKLQENKDINKVKNVNGLFFFCFIVIGSIALLCGAIFLILLNTHVVSFSKFPVERSSAINIVLLIMIIQSALHFPFAVVTIILSYNRKFLFRNLANLLSILLFPFLTVLYIFLGLPGDILISVTIINFIVVLSIDFIKAIFVFVKLKEKVTLKLKKEDFKLLKPMIIYCIVMFASSAVSIIHNATDQVILGTTISAEAVTLYSLSSCFSVYLTSMISSVASLFSPKLTSDAIDGKSNVVLATCNFVWEAIAIILVFVFGGFLTCGLEFVKGWLGPEKSIVYIYAILLMTVNLLTSGINLSYTVQTALNKHKFAAITYIGCLLINIVLSIVLSAKFAIYGVIIATIISKLLETFVLTIYSKKAINLSTKIYWSSLLKNALLAFFCVVFVKGLFSLINLQNNSYYLQAVIRGATYCIVFLPCLYIINKKYIHQFLKILKRKD